MCKQTVIPKIRKETRRIKMVFELKKDLMENEVICEHCNGTGLEIRDNIYGIKGDTTNIGVHFPYKHQSISFCRYCYNGVQEKCSNCGSLRGKMDRECSCGYSERKRHEEWRRKEDERWNRVAKIPIYEAWEKYACLYVNTVDRFVFSQEELDNLIIEYELDDSLLRIYATEEKCINLDAQNIIDNACDELHEDAIENCDIISLQGILDEWCKKQTGTKSYEIDHNLGVTFTNNLF